jgi:hypothetical protein
VPGNAAYSPFASVVDDAGAVDLAASCRTTAPSTGVVVIVVVVVVVVIVVVRRRHRVGLGPLDGL